MLNRPNHTKRFLSSGLLAVLFLCAIACSGTTPATTPPDDSTIDVATFDFPESMVLGEIYSQALQNAGYDVERHIALGPRELVMPAMAHRLVDLVPEYIGTALHFASLGELEPSADQRATRALLDEAMGERGVTLLASAPGQNQNGFAITNDLAERLDLSAVSDLADVDEGLMFGGPPECPQRLYCLMGLESVYGLEFDDFLATDSGGPVTLSTLIAGEVDVALLFTTDPAIERYNLVLLEDDRQLQPAENVTPVIRSELIQEHGPELAFTINAVTRHLSTAELRSLNGDLDSGAANLRSVAAEWLARVGQD